jgi:multiple sugar transport system ATP-binding protein
VARIELERVTKVYDDGTVAVNDLSLSIGDGELIVLVGPSGCGKTSALRMVAGLEEISAGDVRIGDRIVNDLPPRERDIAMVFQNYALYPHMTVFQNIAFGLRMRKVSKEDQRKRVEEAARLLGLADLLDKRPRALSGGQRQRVAMGRAIVRDPQAFLMDEPLSNLDAKLRVQMRAEISRIQQELRVTTLYVTHDQVEAMTMGDRVAVLRRGQLQQIDAPQRLYEEPSNLFVASFIGSPAMNLLEAVVDGGSVRIGETQLPVDTPAPLRTYEGRRLAVGIRPEHLRVASGSRSGGLRGTVLLSEALGSELLVHVDVAATAVTTHDVVEAAIEDEDSAAFLQRDGRRATIVARLDPATPARPGESIELVPDLKRLHFFDLETSRRIASGAESSQPVAVA